MQQEPQIVQVDEIQFVGLEIDHNVHESAKGEPTVPSLWNSFMPRMAEVKNQADHVLGVCGPIRTGGMSLYVAALQVANLTDVPPGMVKGTVPAGKYAEFIHRGPISSFSETVDYIHNTWMPKAGYAGHDCSQIEVMPKGANVDSDDFEMKVLVPLFQ